MPAYLRQEDSTVELTDGEFLVGRSSSCDLPLDDGLVSRRHAVFHFDGKSLRIQDLSSRNGTLVNGELVREDPVELTEGDRVSVGSHEFIVGFSLREERPRSITSPWDLPPAMAPDDETTQASGAALILILAEKALGLGRFAEAERILKPQLEVFLAQAGNKKADEINRLASACLNMAKGKREPEWIDAVFEMFRKSERVPSAPVVDTLHEVVRAIGYDELKPIRGCLATLGKIDAMPPAEKFLLQRLRGLEQVIAA